MQHLAQKSVKLPSHSDFEDKFAYSVGRFIVGCVLIPFSLVLLWKNEKKVVTYTKCMAEGRKQVRSVQPEDADELNEFELVHVTGTTVNSQEVVDCELGVVAHNCYRLKRKVEMY